MPKTKIADRTQEMDLRQRRDLPAVVIQVNGDESQHLGRLQLAEEGMGEPAPSPACGLAQDHREEAQGTSCRLVRLY